MSRFEFDLLLNSVLLLKILIPFQTKDVETLEKTINNGQAEELILQAERELVLARKMLGWKPWEPLVRQPPPTQWQWPPTEIHPQK